MKYKTKNNETITIYAMAAPAKTGNMTVYCSNITFPLSRGNSPFEFPHTKRYYKYNLITVQTEAQHPPAKTV